MIYQVKHLFDLDFTDQTHTRSDHKTRKELTRKSSVGLRPPPPGFYFGNDEVKDLDGRTLLTIVWFEREITALLPFFKARGLLSMDAAS